VTNGTHRTIFVINTTTNTVSDSILGSLLFNPYGLCVNANGSILYVTNSENNGYVYLINTSTNTITDSISVEMDPRGISISPDGLKLYVVNNNSGTVSVINTV